MYLKLTFQSTDYAQKWVVCRVTGGDLVVLCSYLGPCVSAVITNGAPGLRHENPGVLPRFSASAAEAPRDLLCTSVGAEAPRDPLCSCVISTYALPAVRTPYQKQLAWRVAKDSYQDCRDFLHGMRIELFFLGWKGTCNSSISYYTILTQWKKITTPQKLQTCGYVCVLGVLTLDDTRSHMPRAPVVTVFYWCTLCVTKKGQMHTQRTVFLRDADPAQLYRLILW